MSTPTPDHGTAGDETARHDADQPVSPSPGDGDAAQSSGKQFERGTRATSDDAEPATGRSASGKRFARGTDSDGDGRGYDEPGDRAT